MIPAPVSLSSAKSVESDLALPWGSDVEQVSELDAGAIAACVDWLSFHRLWGVLGDDVLKAIAQSLQLLKLAPDQEIYREGQAAAGAYLLKWGSVEIYRTSPVGKTHIIYRSAGEMFGYLPLVTEQVGETYQAGAIALSNCEIWFLPQQAFTTLLHNFPTIQTVLNRLLVTDLNHFGERLAQEQARIQGLQSYLHAIPDHDPVGTSKASQKLSQLIDTATQDIQPILLQAPTGGGKSFVAGTIHRKSGLHDHPFAEIDCAQLPRDATGAQITDALFGQAGGMLGLLTLLERGTLLIDNAHLLSRTDGDRLCHYLQTGEVIPNPPPGTPPLTPPQPQQSWVRVILASPQKLDWLDTPTHTIRLSSLTQRKADIPQFAQHFLDRFCREQGKEPLHLDQADLRRLISYHYPGNLRELAGILQRAVTMTPPGQSVIPEQVLWSVQSPKNAFRIDLLNHIPWLRSFLLSDWWPERFWVLIMLVFVPIVVLGYTGPQNREASATLNLFWAWWWPMYLFLFAFVGRVWCAVCPFMITAEWLRKISLWIWPRQLLPWPTRWLNRWGAWLLFAGFVAIYLWEKLWDLPHHAYLSAWLLLVITAGAVIFSLIYERRLWCRYLCPIGGMNGMFAKLSMVELRSTQQVCGSQCSTFGCYKGSDVVPVNFPDALPNEGQATGGCPLYSHPAQLPDNRDCVLCMTCLKACPNRSVQVNLRFPATDLLENHNRFWAEAALLLLLFGGVFMHHASELLAWVGLPDLPVDSEHLLIGLPVATVFLSIPLVLTYVTHAIARLIDREMPDYLTIIYAYLPFTLAANLAHYIPAGITEAGEILPVLARTLGFSGTDLPTLTWSMDVAHFLQELTLLSALAFSIYPLLRITRRPLLSNLPHLVLLFGLTLFCGWLMIAL